MFRPPILERVADYVPYYASLAPQREALVSEDVRMSFEVLEGTMERVATALAAAGVRKGDVVATLSTPRPEFFVTFLAAARIGAVWLGMNPRSQPPELGYLLDDARPKVIFTIEEFEGRAHGEEIDALCRGRTFVNRVVRLDGRSESGACFAEFLAEGERGGVAHAREATMDVRTDDPALIVYTSGTTGSPKGALISHRGLICCFRAQFDHVHASPLRIVNNLPINHIGSVGDVSTYALISGGTSYFMDRFDPVRVIEVIEREKITVWGQVPTQFQLALDTEYASRADLASLRSIFWSGGAAPLNLVQRLRSITPHLCNAYGLTEAVSNFCYTAPDADDESLANTVGKPDASYEVRIVRPDSAAAKVGEVGEIHVRSKFLMLGYLNQPESTHEVIDDDGWLQTGDLGVWRADGNIRLVGRTKEMFKSGGYNVYPREIEQVIESNDLVCAAVVVEAPHKLYGEVGVAFVQLRSSETLPEEALRRFCADRLANYKIPKRFVFCATYPMLEIGKVNKGALKQRAADMMCVTADFR